MVAMRSLAEHSKEALGDPVMDLVAFAADVTCMGFAA